MLTISNLLSLFTTHGKSTVEPAWALTMVLFFVTNTCFLVVNKPPLFTFPFPLPPGLKFCLTLVEWAWNNRDSSIVPSLFKNKWVSSTGEFTFWLLLFTSWMLLLLFCLLESTFWLAALVSHKGSSAEKSEKYIVIVNKISKIWFPVIFSDPWLVLMISRNP